MSVIRDSSNGLYDEQPSPTLFGMRHGLLRECAILLLACPCFAQSTSQLRLDKVTVLKLFVPAYPKLARAARIEGDIDVALNIEPDGHVQSAVIVSGPFLLRQPALVRERSKATV